MTVAFVFSAGANLGPLQAGTAVALMEAGIEPDLLVGTSVGALNAAFLSTRPGLAGAKALMATWSALRRREAFRFNVITALAGFGGVRNHLLPTQPFLNLIRRWVQIDNLEEATVALAVIATDALTGEDVVLTTGNAVRSLAASAAIPGLFPPVRIGGRWLVDGALSASHPVSQAQDLGADVVYLISTATAPRLRPPRGAVAVAMNSVALLTARSARAQLVAATIRAEKTGGRVVVVPAAGPRAPGPFDFGKSDALADAAYQRTAFWLSDEARLLRADAGGAPATPDLLAGTDFHDDALPPDTPLPLP